MNYGNVNDVTGVCGRCGQNIDKHKPFNVIKSDDETEKLARDFQAKLDGVRKHGLLKGYDPDRQAAMVGAVVARIANGTYKWVALSGGALDYLRHVTPLAKDVTIISAVTATPLTTFMGEPLRIAQPAANNRNRDYPVGSCAAQKLLMAVFNKAQEKGGGSKIQSINMAEILWSDPSVSGHNRDWSTGDVVCSCDTCKRVVPQMLCGAEV